MLEIRQLYYLIEVAKYNSINKAAENLFITKAAVSTAIKQLEKNLGYDIIERTYRGVRLTEDGEKVVKMAEQILGLCREIESLGNKKIYLQSEKYDLIVQSQILKLLSSKIIGFDSHIMDQFSLVEETGGIEDICESLEPGKIALIGLSNKERCIVEQYEEMNILDLWTSKLYPISKKNTKWIDNKKKKITPEELKDLPQVVLPGLYPKGKNIVLETANPEIYAQAIMSDYGIGVIAHFSPEIFVCDCRFFKEYEPLDEEEVSISIISCVDHDFELVQKLEQLLKT